eukprot:jgi/Pico_ML_1/53211/g3791.t1
MEEEILAKEETIRAFRNAWEAGQEKIVALEKEVHRARKKDLEIERLKQQVEELNEEVRCCHLEMQENRTSMAMWQDKMMENGTQQEELVEEEANVESLVEFVESEPIPFDEIDEFNLHERLERAETGWRFPKDAGDGDAPPKDVVERLDEVLTSSRRMRQEMEAASAPSTPEPTSSGGRSTAGFIQRASLSHPGVASRASPLSVERLRACVQDALAPRLGAEAAFAHSTTVRAVSPGVFTIGGRRTTCVGLPRTVMVRVGGGWSTLDDALEGMSMPTPSPDEEGSPFGSSLAS